MAKGSVEGGPGIGGGQSGTARVLALCTVFLFMGLIAFSYCGREKSLGSTGSRASLGPRHARDLLPESGHGLTAAGEILVDDALTFSGAADERTTPAGTPRYEDFAGRQYKVTVDDRPGTVRMWIYRTVTPEEARTLGGDLASAGGTPTTDFGSEGRIEAARGSTTIRFWRDAYRVVMTIDGTSSGAQALLGLLAMDVDEGIRRP